MPDQQQKHRHVGHSGPGLVHHDEGLSGGTQDDAQICLHGFDHTRRRALRDGRHRPLSHRSRPGASRSREAELTVTDSTSRRSSTSATRGSGPRVGAVDHHPQSAFPDERPIPLVVESRHVRLNDARGEGDAAHIAVEGSAEVFAMIVVLDGALGLGADGDSRRFGEEDLHLLHAVKTDPNVDASGRGSGAQIEPIESDRRHPAGLAR